MATRRELPLTASLFTHLGVIGLLAGCSAVVDPDTSRLGGEPDGSIFILDSGRPRQDGGASGNDAGPPVPDAGGNDAGPPGPDAGPTCVGAARCEGDVRVSCVAGAEERTSCTEMRAYCASGECRPWMCTPGTSACSPDTRSVVNCSARGDSQTTTPCELGCDPTTNACRTSSLACMGLPRIALGDTTRFNLCFEPNGDTHLPAPGCDATTEANVGDRTFTLTLEEATDVVMELTDDDGTTGVDTLLYVRRVCDSRESQIACSDDVPCSESTVPGSPPCSGTGSSAVQVRQSRIVTRLEAGTYYIVADGFAYSMDGATFRCGQVELAVDGR
jgi:hypothetical protein